MSAHSLERSSRVHTDFSIVSSGCDSIGDEGYLKDIPLICGIFVVPFSKPEMFHKTHGKNFLCHENKLEAIQSIQTYHLCERHTITFISILWIRY